MRVSNRKQILLVLACVFAMPIVASAAPKKEPLIYGAQLEEWEYRRGEDKNKLVTWDGSAFIGNDDIKFRWVSEGDYDLRAGMFGETENRLLAQIPASMFFDIKSGVRLATYGNGRENWHAVFGATGLAPQWFEIDADLFIGDGHTSARLDAEYELLLTNWVTAVFSAESTYSFATDEKAGIGTGVVDLEVGARLSYDIVDRSVAPYIGVEYEKKYGDTGSIARAEGEKDAEWLFVVGVRLML